jgi:hypothetical protein
MMLAAGQKLSPLLIVEWAAAGGAALAAVSALSGPLRRFVFKPVFWVFRQLIGDPITEWAKSTFDTLVDERIDPTLQEIAHAFRANGTPSLSDQIAELQAAVAELKAGQAAAARRLSKLDRHVGDVHTEVVGVKAEVTTGNSQSMGELADAGESRRIQAIPDSERSDTERGHIIDNPVPPSKARE